jgi:hypothetical protein
LLHSISAECLSLLLTQFISLIHNRFHNCVKQSHVVEKFFSSWDTPAGWSPLLWIVVLISVLEVLIMALELSWGFSLVASDVGDGSKLLWIEDVRGDMVHTIGNYDSPLELSRAVEVWVANWHPHYFMESIQYTHPDWLDEEEKTDSELAYS